MGSRSKFKNLADKIVARTPVKILQKEFWKILKTVGGDRFSPNHYKMVEKGSEMKLKKKIENFSDRFGSICNISEKIIKLSLKMAKIDPEGGSP